MENSETQGVHLTAEQILGKRVLICCHLSNELLGDAFEVTVDECEPTTGFIRIPKIQGGIYKWIHVSDVIVLAELAPVEPTINTAYLRKYIADALIKNSWSDAIIPREMAIQFLKSKD